MTQLGSKFVIRIVSCVIFIVTGYTIYVTLKGVKYENNNGKDTSSEALAGRFTLVRNVKAEDLKQTLYEAESRLHGHVTTQTANCKTKRVFGRKGDGGYSVCMDSGIAPRKGDCLVYSFGIRDEWSFDDAMSTEQGCEVHSFDPSMSQENHIRHTGVRFHNIGIWDSDIVNAQNWTLKSLTSIRKMLNHTNRVIDYLKLDVEGAEWPLLYEMLSSKSTQFVKQIALEIHTPNMKGNPMTVADLSQVYGDLKAFQTQLGFRLFSEKHTNGCCGRFAVLTSSRINKGNYFPISRDLCCYELFYVKENLYSNNR